MSNRSLVFLSLVTLGLVIYLGLFGFEDPGTDALRERATRLIDFKRSAVDRIEVVHLKSEVLLAREGSPPKWSIKVPSPYPADATQVDRLFSELEFAKRHATLDPKRFEDTAAALKQLGLDNPKAEIRLRGEKHSYQIALGNATARSGQIYAQIQVGKSTDWVVVDESLLTFVTSSMEAWRSRNIFDLESPSVTGITLTESGRETQLSRGVDGWEVQRPFQGGCGPGSVDSFLANLLGGRIEAFVSDTASDPGAYGLNNPTWSLTIQEGETAHVLRIGSEVPGAEGSRYAQLGVREHVFQIKKAQVDQIASMLATVREKRVLPAEIQAIRSLNLSGPERETWDLAYDEGGWYFSSDAAPADPSVLKTFLTELQSANGVEFLESSDTNRKSFGLQRPDWVLGLSFDSEFSVIGVDQADSFQIRISPEREGFRYVESDFSAFIMKVPNPEIPVIPSSRVSWLARTMNLPEMDKWKSLTWRTAGADLMLVRDSDLTWPAQWNGRKIDQNFLDRQKNLLAALPVVDRVLVNPSSFTDTALALDLETVDGQIYSLKFLPPQDRRVVLMVNDQTDGFVIEERDLALLQVFPLDQSSDSSVQ